jgi:hypothetical protein
LKDEIEKKKRSIKNQQKFNVEEWNWQKKKKNKGKGNLYKVNQDTSSTLTLNQINIKGSNWKKK